MKSLIKFSFFIFFTSLFTYAQATQNFRVTGNIKGIVPGDTLEFYKILLPEWDYEKAYTIIVKDNDNFILQAKQPHTQIYRMTYKPVTDNFIPPRHTWGVDIMARDGDNIVISGERDRLYSSIRSGGVFDDDNLQKLYHLRDSLEVEQNKIDNLFNLAKEAQDSAKMDEYGNALNNWYAKEEYTLAYNCSNEFLKTTIDSNGLHTPL